MECRSLVLRWGTLVCLCSLAFAHTSGLFPPPPPKPPPPPPTPATPPNSGVPPGSRKPFDPPPPDDGPPAPTPTTPPPHDPGTPTTPSPAPAPEAPPAPERTRPNPRSRRGATTANAWRFWWELNRDHLVGLRARMRRAAGAATTGPKRGTLGDPLGDRRLEVRRRLRAVIERKTTHPKLAATLLIALGRVGASEDTSVYLRGLRDRDRDVASAAALGIGLLPSDRTAEMRTRVARALDRAVFGRRRRVRGFAFVGAGLRARRDPAVALHLARYARHNVADGYDASVLAFSCGTSRDSALLPELLVAVRRGTLGKAKLDDVGRSHAIAGLGQLRAPAAVAVLAKLIRSRRTGAQSRRAAALALGRLLRDAPLMKEQVKVARHALIRVLEKSHDSILQGFAFIALGSARVPAGVERMKRDVDHGGDLTRKTFAALALGLAAGRLPKKQARRVRAFLVEELQKTNDPELGPALAIAAGLAEATNAAEPLRAMLAKKSRPASVRASAAEALGLVGARDKATSDALLATLRTGNTSLVEGAALGLGLLGRRGVSGELLDRFDRSSSRMVQSRLTVALVHLGDVSVLERLLALVEDERRPREARSFAAIAVGKLGAMDDDPLVDLEAYMNYFATTLVTHELLTIL